MLVSQRLAERDGVKMSVITLKSVEKAFGSVKAVNGLSFEVNKGEITGFLGANGAGKTTTIKMLLGFFQPDAGSLLVAGDRLVLSLAEGL
jgi:ABC-2 type transport system ATP-binding protein